MYVSNNKFMKLNEDSRFFVGETTDIWFKVNTEFALCLTEKETETIIQGLESCLREIKIKEENK